MQFSTCHLNVTPSKPKTSEKGSCLQPQLRDLHLNVCFHNKSIPPMYRCIEHFSAKIFPLLGSLHCQYFSQNHSNRWLLAKVPLRQAASTFYAVFIASAHTARFAKKSSPDTKVEKRRHQPFSAALFFCPRTAAALRHFFAAPKRPPSAPPASSNRSPPGRSNANIKA